METGSFLPFWLIGAPLLLAVVDRLMTPGPPVTRGSTTFAGADRAPVR